MALAALSQFAGAMFAAGRAAGQKGPASGSRLFDEVTAKVLPANGFQSKIRLGASIAALVEKGVIERQKFPALYKERGGLPPELAGILAAPSDRPILLTRGNANHYVNLLWPLGLSNTMFTNANSPLNGASLFDFASMQARFAEPTFFQDCNHGSALLGLLQLGAAQGLTEDQLYREALAFNSFWFPRNYIQTALYFKAVKNTDWGNVDAKQILGFAYSALGAWSKNVQAEVARIPNLLPQNSGAACAV